MKNGKFDFFLAYAKKDERIALKIYQKLVLKSTVFFSKEKLMAGDDWDIAIPEAQRNSKITVVLISHNSSKAFYQREEIAAAIDMAREGNHRVVPLYITDPEKLANIPYGLKTKQSIIAVNESELDSAINEFIALLSLPGPRKKSGSKGNKAAAEENSKLLKIIFSDGDLYPNLNFSIGNTSDEEIQITNIKVIELASDYYDSPSISYFESPRSILEYSLNTKQESNIVFGKNSVEYIPSRKFAAFQVQFKGEYVISLLDIKIDFVSINLDNTQTAGTGCFVLIKALFESGIIQVVKQNELFKFLKNLDTIASFGANKKDDPLFGDLIAKNANRIWKEQAHDVWKIWAKECYNQPFFAEGMLSFAEAIGVESLPDEFIRISYQWLMEFKNYREYPIARLWKVVAINSNKLPEKIPGYAYYFKLIDEGINDPKEQEFRESIMSYLPQDLGSVQYIMAVMLTKPESWERIVIHTLAYILRPSKTGGHISIIDQYNSVPIWPLTNEEIKFQLWKDWWKENGKLKVYDKLEWKKWSPNILKKLKENEMSSHF